MLKIVQHSLTMIILATVLDVGSMMTISGWKIVFLGMLVLAISSTARDMKTREAKVVGRILELYKHNKTYARHLDRTFKTKQPRLKAEFPCPNLSPSTTVPTSVHSLRPSDIKVVAAIGDSLTAGRGVEGGVLGLLIDYRGLAWCIGGDETYSEMPTVPNILSQYNPSLYGFSQGVGSLDAHFNMAETGAKSNEGLGQAKELVSRMSSDKHIDFDNDWKVITVFIGANDLCDFCEDRGEYSVEKYAQNLQSILDYLHENVPRAFVNLVEVLNVETVQELAKNFVCQAIHFFTCDCAANPRTEEDRAELINLREGYQVVARNLVASGRYETRDDFTVVLQPFYRETFLPMTSTGELDFSFFASDCFHYSRKGQQAAAEALWNNMVEPIGSKRLMWTPGEPIECPTEAFPYLYTAKNSNFTISGNKDSLH